MLRAGICLAVAFAVTGLAGPADNSAQNTTNKEMQNPKAKLSKELGQMLDATNKARTSIAQHNKQQATKEVDQALNSVNAATTQHTGTDLVPIYTELEQVSVLEPIMNRHKTGTATASKGSSQSGSADRSASTSTQSNAALGVHEVVGNYSGAFLDVSAAKQHLQAAQQALNKNDLNAADRDLQAVQDSVVLESVSADMPLLRARENLVLARSSEDAGKYEQAKRQLHAASTALHDYAQISGSHTQDVSRLRSDIDSYADSLATNHSNADSKIEGWWDQTTNWITPASASNSKNTNAPRR
jgi:hypothetical protein